jgi:hypothetical protein
MFYKGWGGKQQQQDNKTPHTKAKIGTTTNTLAKYKHRHTKAHAWAFQRCPQEGEWCQNIIIVSQAEARQGFRPSLVPIGNW